MHSSHRTAISTCMVFSDLSAVKTPTFFKRVMVTQALRVPTLFLRALYYYGYGYWVVIVNYLFLKPVWQISPVRTQAAEGKCGLGVRLVVQLPQQDTVSHTTDAKLFSLR